MKFMNDHEISQTLAHFTFHDRPNLQRGSAVLVNLRDWANRNSDGWAYWPKPARAARQLMELLSERHYVADITEAELKTALRPIKSFLTRQGVNHSEVIPS